MGINGFSHKKGWGDRLIKKAMINRGVNHGFLANHAQSWGYVGSGAIA